MSDTTESHIMHCPHKSPIAFFVLHNTIIHHTWTVLSSTRQIIRHTKWPVYINYGLWPTVHYIKCVTQLFSTYDTWFCLSYEISLTYYCNMIQCISSPLTGPLGQHFNALCQLWIPRDQVWKMLNVLRLTSGSLVFPTPTAFYHTDTTSW